MSRIIKCDRCGAEIKGDIGFVSVTIRNAAGEILEGNTFENMDY